MFASVPLPLTMACRLAFLHTVQKWFSVTGKQCQSCNAFWYVHRSGIHFLPLRERAELALHAVNGLAYLHEACSRVSCCPGWRWWRRPFFFNGRCICMAGAWPRVGLCAFTVLLCASLSSKASAGLSSGSRCAVQVSQRWLLMSAHRC